MKPLVLRTQRRQVGLCAARLHGGVHLHLEVLTTLAERRTHRVDDVLCRAAAARGESGEDPGRRHRHDVDDHLASCCTRAIVQLAQPLAAARVAEQRVRYACLSRELAVGGGADQRDGCHCGAVLIWLDDGLQTDEHRAQWVGHGAGLGRCENEQLLTTSKLVERHTAARHRLQRRRQRQVGTRLQELQASPISCCCCCCWPSERPAN